MLCAPGVEMITMVGDEELAAKASERVPPSTRSSTDPDRPA
jgi:hypothetical protein